MAKLPVLNFDKASVSEIEISEDVTETPYHPSIIKDAVVHFLAGQRQGTHSTKTRSQVSGSTIKPWKQKGTGRARSGSTKSPIWRHGGIVFGPVPRDHSKSMNKKVRKQALCSALAEKIRNNQVVVIEHLDLQDHKTKKFQTILTKLECQHALIVVDELPRNLSLASRNLPEVQVINYRTLNVYKLLRYKKVIFVKEALSAVEERLLS
ncbi:MAG: 50S ribosomal protein L4 [SAR324 cluster bacterium]|nr:50S ribosomal protein L4 [SAR324 cluster bacterium]